jgi:hypothetical protein
VFIAEVDEAAGVNLIAAWVDANSVHVKSMRRTADLSARFNELYGYVNAAPVEKCTTDPCSKLVVMHMERIGCKSPADFTKMTLLDQAFFWQFSNRTYATRKPNTIWSIIAGFRLIKDDALDLLNKAGIVLLPKDKPHDRVFCFMLDNLEGCPIEDWNSFLTVFKMPQLGSKSRA